MAAGSGPTLFGRSCEIGAIDELIGATAAGAGGGLALFGEPGVGKSALVAAAAESACRAGLDVLIGRAVPLEISWPMAAVLDALALRAADLLGPIDESRSLLEAGASAARRFLLADRLLEAVESRCAERPVLLVLEDLQWADATTIGWIGEIAARSISEPLAVLVTARSPSPSSPLLHLFDRPGLTRVDLPALARGDVYGLARAVLGGDPGPRLRDELDGAGGNPLLVHAVLDALVSSGALLSSAGSVELARRVPLRAKGPIASQVGELDSATLRVVQVAAVMGPAFALDDLAVVLGVRGVDVLSALDIARGAGVIATAGERYAFSHELHRDAVLATLPEAAIGPIHLDVARALAAAGAPALTVAEHFARGARPGNREAVAWLQQAAIEVVDQAPGTAMRLLDVALALSSTTPSPSLLLARVRALSGAGHTADAEALGRSLLREGLPREQEARLHRELGFAYFVEGRAAEAVAELERYGQLIVDDSMRGRASAELAFTHFVNLDHPRARAAAEGAVAEGRRTGDVAAEVGGGGVLAWLDLFRCDFVSACRRAEEIVTLAEQPHAAQSHLYQPWLLAGLVWVEAGDFGRARHAVRRGQELAGTQGAAWAIPGYDALNAFAAVRCGDLDDAAAAANAALGYLDGADGFGVAVWCHSFLALIALHRGDEAIAETHIATAEEWVVRGRAQFGVELCLLARARLHDARGDRASAIRVLGDAWDLCTGIGLVVARQLLAPDLVRWAMTERDCERAAAVAAAADEAARVASTDAFASIASLAAALLNGDAAGAMEAVALARRTDRVPLLATALTDAATLLARAGRGGEASRCANEAAHLWSAMGADFEAAAAVRAGGGGRMPARRPRFGLGALTNTERKVADLITEGLSNVAIARRLSVSRRTVESHVSSAYRKVGVSSRVELARIVLDHRRS